MQLLRDNLVCSQCRFCAVSLHTLILLRPSGRHPRPTTALKPLPRRVLRIRPRLPQLRQKRLLPQLSRHLFHPAILPSSVLGKSDPSHPNTHSTLVGRSEVSEVSECMAMGWTFCIVCLEKQSPSSTLSRDEPIRSFVGLVSKLASLPLRHLPLVFTAPLPHPLC